MTANKKMEGVANDKIQLGELEHSIGFLLTLAHVNVTNYASGNLDQHKLGPGAASVLMVIQLNPLITHGNLANALKIKLARMTKLIKALEKRGLVERHKPSRDKRIVELLLTQQGETLANELKTPLLQTDDAQFGWLNPAEKSVFIDVLTRFVKRDAQNDTTREAAHEY